MQGADRKVAGDVPVGYAGDCAPVVKVYDGTVVAHIPVFQKQVSEIRTPFLVRSVRPEILPQQVPEHLVGLARPCPRFFGADNGVQPQFPVHIFMDGGGAVMVPPAPQIDCHTVVAVNTIMAVVDLTDLLMNLRFFCMVGRLPVFPVVIVCIWVNPQPP